MLADADVSAVIAVKDMATAKEFYEDKLGLKPGKTDPSGTAYKGAGDGTLFVYESEFAGSNKATAMAWNVDDIETVAKDLKAKGITFEHYDLPGVKLEGDVHVMGPLKAVWFKDPDGNILNVTSGM